MNGVETGWKLVRIPISHFTQIQDITLSEIRYLRLIVSGVNQTSTLEIARIELVGNTWESMGTSLASDNDCLLYTSDAADE